MAEGTSTKSYDGIDKAALFELLKKKKIGKTLHLVRDCLL